MPIPPRGLRVLAVDDERSSLQTVKTILECAGFEITATHDASHARDLLRNESRRFDVVLTDLFFFDEPRGYEIAAAARECRPAVPVVMLTGKPSFGTACNALRSQVAEILEKPTDPNRLVETCRRVVLAAEIDRRTNELRARNRILALVVPRMVEAKDATTSGHSERVIGYSDALARMCGVNERDRESLQLAALLHDVGKIGIPKAILCKPGPLDADERAIIQQHPEIGRTILSGLEDSESVQNWVYQHHERWDGRGYPNGLVGEEVELPGRILVLAEVYDALIEARSYKQPWPMPKIIDFFRQEAGKHFDPDLAHRVADGLEAYGKEFFEARPATRGFDALH